MSGTECKLEKLKKQVKRIIGNEVSDMGINKERNQQRYLLSSDVIKRVQYSSFALGFGIASFLTSLMVIFVLYLRG